MRSRWFVLAAAAALAVAPAVLGKFGVSLMNDIGIAALVVLGLVLLTGVGGATSFGQAAFVGIAAYTSAWLSTAQGWSPWIGLLFALVFTAAAALMIGALTLRLGGHFLPLSTIAWGLSIALLFGNMEMLGRHTGISNIPPIRLFGVSLADPRAVYYLIWVLVGLGALFCHNVLASRPGRAIRSLRGGGILLASVGADAYRVRLSLFVLAALLAAVAGWLYAHANRFVSPSPFDVRASIEYLLMAVAGGFAHLAGALVGAAVVLVMKNVVQDTLPLITARGGQFEAVAFALLFIVLLHRARGGVMGLVTRWMRTRFPPRVAALPAEPTEPLPRRQPVPRGQPLLAVHGAVKRFGGLVAVNEVSFEVRAGEIVGLIGPNGAGKSTMFDLITGTAPMTSGRVEFLGRDITGMAQRRVALRGMARTFQHVKLRPQMSLLDNVALGAHGRTRAGLVAAGLRLDRREEAKIQHEARRQLERMGLADRAHELAGSLPLGTQRLLEIARALACDPVLLVLDEPAAGLRRQEKQALAELLRKLRGEGITILIVEHDMDFVMRLVDRLVVMNFGSKLVEGEPAAVRADPMVQAAYLGSVATECAMTSAAMLEIGDLHVSYGQVDAVRGVSLSLLAGQIVSVIGPNGAGKTTLLGAAMGLLPSTGTLRFEGHDLHTLDVEARVERGLCLVPEKRELFGELTVLDNLMLGAYTQRRRGGASLRGRLDAVYARFPRLAERHAQRADTLSGGERQMLAIGRALMAQPRLLMLDEPSLGPRAAGGAGDLRHRAPPARGRCRDPAGGAERARRARELRPRLRAGDRRGRAARRVEPARRRSARAGHLPRRHHRCRQT